MKNQKGFTLIELMIVVAIIAILAAIAISQYQDYVIRSQVSEGSSLADGVKTAVGEFVNNYGRYPNATGLAANISFGLAVPNSIRGSYVGSITTAGGLITANYSSTAPFKANTALTSPTAQTLQFSPTTHAGSISWTCKSTMPDKWLPASCR